MIFVLTEEGGEYSDWTYEVCGVLTDEGEALRWLEGRPEAPHLTRSLLRYEKAGARLPDEVISPLAEQRREIVEAQQRLDGHPSQLEEGLARQREALARHEARLRAVGLPVPA